MAWSEAARKAAAMARALHTRAKAKTVTNVGDLHHVIQKRLTTRHMRNAFAKHIRAIRSGEAQPHGYGQFVGAVQSTRIRNLMKKRGY